jgi:hypothetical protein
MKTRGVKTLGAMILGALLMFAAPALYGAEPVLEAKQIEQLAKKADSSEEHAVVAKHYRARAENLEAEADKLEREVRQRRSATNPMAAKWPAMTNSGIPKKERLAMQARRAARECLQLAVYHQRLAGDERPSE